MAGLICRYNTILPYIGVIGGCIGFIFRLRSQLYAAILKDKFFIYEILNEYHETVIADKETKNKRDVIQHHNRANPYHQIFVPELVVVCRRNQSPCVPEKLYERIVASIRPASQVRVDLLFKIVSLGVFFAIFHLLMSGLSFYETDETVSFMQIIGTAVALVFPTLLAKLETNLSKEIVDLKKRQIIFTMITKFLNDNPNYYNYDTKQVKRVGADIKQAKPSVVRFNDKRL